MRGMCKNFNRRTVRVALATCALWVFAARAVEVADMPDAVPGLEVSAEVVFDAVPKDGITFIGNEAWSLMYQPWQGQGSFAFQVGSQWYNTALAEQPIETGKVYRVTGSWDGAVIRVALEGGKEGRQIRRDPMPPVRKPTVMWPFAGTVKAYSAKVVAKPIVHLFDLKSKDLLPRAGKPFTLTGEAFSGGTSVADAVLVAEVKTPGASVTPARLPLGKRFAGTVPCEWTVEAGTNGEVVVDFRVEADGRTLCAETKDVVVMPAEDPDFSAAKWNPPERPTRTFYVDALAGDDARDGLSPQSAWKTLGRVRGRVLGPGERLLLRRGSVFNEELEIGACGAADNWASVGAYGTGARPTIRRDRMFDQRCLLVTNAAYFAVRDLVVCNAGKGLCIENPPGVGGHVLVENCLAHHVEGSYRWNAHGIPEWRDLSAPKDGGVGAIALTGMRHLVFRDCETYQNSWGFNVKGDDLWIGRIYTHDNASPNTSPHPMITGTKRAWYIDSVLDASGWNASAGTMGIMLCVNRGFVIRGVHFLNMPDSASWDEGGVDFESGGEGILVDRCTFRRNAGAAIEVLGLYTPQARNLHFRECRFDRNNWANNLGPSEIYIHGAQEKSIDCSCGLIERCGYVLEPGIAFYTNKSRHSSKAWTLKDNREWPTSEELDRAMPWGDPPTVSAGPEIWTSARTVRLAGAAEAGDRKVDVAWETREGPGEVRFARPSDPKTDATFPCAGDWRVALKADDGKLWRTARTAVHVLPEGSVTMRAWSFAKNHDLEGWTHWNLGTTREVFKGKSAFWDTFANPVHDVVGDYYVVALKSAKGAHLLSPDDLYLSKDGLDRVRIRMQNRTNAAKMRLRYLTTEDADWDDAKSVVFDVTPEDRDERVYEIPLALRGHLKRLRLDFAADGTSVTGTVRIDYVWLGRVSGRTVGVTAVRLPPETVTNGYCSVTAGGKVLDVFALPHPRKYFDYQRESDLRPYGAVFFEVEGETEVAGTFADGKRFSFRARPPFTRVVENGGRHGALVICANPPERDVPDRNDPKVKWFGPGRHRPGEIRLASGETLYLAAGAVVEAPVLAEGKDISVRGRGILSGIPWEWRKGPSQFCWTFHGERISIRDVTLAGAWYWALMLERTKDVTVEGVRILGGKALNDDGVDVCRSENVTIRNAFIRSQDDCIAPKWWCRNLLVENCTLWTDYANVVRLGWECDPQGGPFENLVFRNLTVCHLAMEKRPASHEWFNSAFCLQASNGQTIRDVCFDHVDFTGVEPGDIQFVAYTGPCGPFAGGGRIDRVRLRDFTVPAGAAPMITRYAAHAPGEIGTVTLENVAGRKDPELVNDDGPTEVPKPRKVNAK